MKSKGFTFIEMLVVVTLIGILSMIGVANFKVANQKARDGRRQGDLQQIRAALELYRTDENIYPTTDNLNLLVPDYIGTIPTDPMTGYLYPYTSATGTTYTLCSGLELGTTIQTDCGTGCGSGINCRYKITNPL